jgi:integrase
LRQYADIQSAKEAANMKKAIGKIYERTVTVKGHSYQRYDVYLGTLDGKRSRKTFATESEAQTHLKVVDGLENKIGRMAQKLNDADLRDATTAIDILNRRVSLKTAARFYMDHNYPTGGNLTTAEAVDKFLQSRVDKNLRAVTVADYKTKLSLFAREMDGKPLCRVTTSVVENWLQTRNVSVGSRKAYLRALSAFFQWATAKKKLMPENPARSIDSPREDRNEVTYLAVADAERLLNATVATRPELLPYVALGMFAGLRPSEIHGDKTDHPPLDWSKIDFVRKIITVDAKQTKTRDGRRVEMSDNLVRWLFSHRRDQGPIFFTRTALAAVVTKAGIDFPKDVLRHTCGTYMYASRQHEGQVAVMLGDTIKTVKRHYVNPMVDRVDADKFWALQPSTEEGVIAFPQQATA